MRHVAPGQTVLSLYSPFLPLGLALSPQVSYCEAMNNTTWNHAGRAPRGPWDHITPEMREAERQRIRKMSDKKLIAYYHEAKVPMYKRSAQWEITMIRKLMTREELGA